MRLRQGARVLDRGEGTLHVGVRPPLIVGPLTAPERRFLERLETAHHITRGERSRFAPLIALLADADLFEPPAAPARTVAINDAGPVGLGVAMALARAGWAVRFVDEGPASASPPHTYPAGTLAATRQAAAADTVARLNHGTDVRVGAPHADAWVLISHGAAALDEAVGLMARDIPHVFAVIDERGAEVGPLVMPGAGACGMCAGIERAALDPAWPVLSLQLRAQGVSPPRAAPDVIATLSGLACGALGAWRGSADREPRAAGDRRAGAGAGAGAGGEGISGAALAWLNRVWVVTADSPPVSRALTPAVDCGCGAAGPIGDEVAARRARF